MRSALIGTVLAVGVGLAAAPTAAEAQQGDWWDWALREVAEARDFDRDDRADRDRRGRADRGGTLADIIFGRDGADRDDRRERAERAERRDRRDRRNAEARGQRGGGPPFCRNGEGHPVHGQQWCREKGFGSGGGILWEQRRWEDIILRAPRDRGAGVMDRGGLIDILGAVVYGRLVQENRRLGGSQPLTARWVRPGGSAAALQIRSGSVPVAELSDVDGDGRVDAVLVPRR